MLIIGFDVRQSRAFAVSVLVTLMVGCSTPRFVDQPSLEKIQKTTTTPVTLDQAYAYSREARSNLYRSYIAEVEERHDVTNSLIGLGAITLGLAAGGAHSDAILISSGLGATIYAYSQAGRSEKPLLAYKAGIEAVLCAELAMLPFTESDGVSSLKDALRRTQDAVTHLQMKNGKLLAAIRNYSTFAEANQSVLTGARQTAASVEQGINEASAVFIKAVVLQRGADQAGRQLRHATDKIVMKVNEAVGDVTVSLDALPGIIAGIGEATGIIAPGLGVPAYLTEKAKDAFREGDAEPQSATTIKPVDERDAAAMKRRELLLQAESKVQTAETDVRTAQAFLSMQTSTLVAINESINRQEVVEGLKKCAVGDLGGGLSVSADTVELNARQAGKRRIVVTGGQRPYRAVWMSSPNKGLELQAPVGMGQIIEVIATEEYEGSTHEFLILDSHENSIQYGKRVIIRSAEAGAGQGNGSSGVSKDAKALNEKMSGEEVAIEDGDGSEKSLTIDSVSVADDGRGFVVQFKRAGTEDVRNLPHANAVKAIRAMNAKGLSVGSVIGETQSITFKPDGVIAAPGAGPQSGSSKSPRRGTTRWGSGVAEYQKRAEDIKALQKLFGVKEDGIWGKNTQKGLEDCRTHNSLPTTGAPSAAELYRLLNQVPADYCGRTAGGDAG